jgi:predicted outer membrane repeat protein
MKSRLHLTNWILGALAIFFVFLPDSPALAASYNCNLYPNLQACINAASDGDVLDIDPGTYAANLTVHNKDITLRGSTQAATIIQASDSSQRVVTADSSKGLRLENLTITGGHPTADIGGGVYAAGGTLQIVNCHITGNSAIYGGGIFLDNAASSLEVSGSLIDLNSSANHGGGIFAAGGAELDNTQLASNTAAWHGGGLHVQNGATVLTGGTYTNNHATNGNGGAVNVNNNLSITGSQFSGNTSGGQGGAVTQWNAPSTVTINEATFSNNTAYNMGGGAYVAGALTLTKTTFTANKADTLSSGSNVHGGGLYALGPLSVDGATFNSNQVSCKGCTDTDGGGLYSGYSTGTITVTNSTFDGNKGWLGSGIEATNLNVTHSMFENGGAGGSGGYGGGIDATTLTGDDLLFQDNTVVNEGGAVDAIDVTVTHSRFIHNTATHGGGAIKHSGTFNGSNLLFARNQASQNGAVLYLERSYAAATLYNITIAQPTQGTGPAVYLDPGAVMNLYNSIVTNYTNAIDLSGTGSKLTEDYNLFYNNLLDVVLHSGSIYNPGSHTYKIFPPDFVNPTAGDYHLTYVSKAVGGGHNYGLTDDLDFRPRLNGRNDIGAYQYWAMIFLPCIIK